MRFIVPTEAEGQSKVVIDGPFVLAIDPVFIVARGKERIPKANARLERLSKREAVGRIALESELGISKEALVDVVVHCVEVPANLEAVSAHRRQWSEVEIVAELQAALIELLDRAVASQTTTSKVIQTDEAWIERRRIPAVFLKRHSRFVQRVGTVPEIANCSAIHPIFQIGCRLERRAAAEVARLVLAAIVDAAIDGIVGCELPAQLAESQVGFEWAGKDAGKLAERYIADARLICILSRNGDWRRRVLIIAFISDEKVEMVFDNRAAETDSRLNAVIRRIRGQCRELKSLRRCRNPALRLVVAEGLAVELVAARLGDGGNNRARRVIVLRAVVLRDHAELLHCALWERISAA